jgi:hypothetical protein
LLTVLTLISACNEGGADFSSFEPLDAFDAQAAVTDAERYLGAGTTVLAVCGGSIGSSLFLDQSEKGFVEDSINGGVIVFALRSDGSPDVLTRDVSREMFVATEDGGQIHRLHGRDNTDKLGVWVIHYPATGVVVSHNLANSDNGELTNVWTQNKPKVGPLPARTSTFLSRCETRS